LFFKEISSDTAMRVALLYKHTKDIHASLHLPELRLI
jgi:hypothetical protein